MKINNNVPFVDLGIQYKFLNKDIQKAISEVCEKSIFVLGEQVEIFERDFAKYSGANYCIALANGTDALELSLLAMGISKGDRVIVPANTFAATAMAVVRVGAIPVFVDCDLDYYLIEAKNMDHYKAKAIIAVNLYGQIAPIEALRRYNPNMIIIEDAAQSHGGRYKKFGMGCISDIAATSFYPTKNLGCYGDGGAILTHSSIIAEKVRKLRNYGSIIKYHHDSIGFNSRLDEIQAAILNIKLKHLNHWNKSRVEAAKIYNKLLKNLVVSPKNMLNNYHVYHLYVIQVKQRDKVLNSLISNGIDARIHYPIPLHLQPAFSYLNYKIGDFPNVESIASHMISLPIFPEITLEQQKYVVSCLELAL